MGSSPAARREFSVWLRDSARKETELTTGGVLGGRGWVHATTRGTPGTFVVSTASENPGSGTVFVMLPGVSAMTVMRPL